MAAPMSVLSQTALPVTTSAFSIRAVVVLPLLFLAALLPLLGDVASYRGDESLYTDAAVTMIDTHDWLTPRYVDGERDGQLRLNKPIVSYWLIAGSLQLLPNGHFAARLPFLLCGCLVIVMAWLTARKLFASSRAALIAALIMCSNPELWATSIRTMPDIPLTLFMSVSVYGFVALLSHQPSRWWHHACAYLGAALAVETKGALGIVPVILAWLVCAVIARGQARRLSAPATMILALVVGAGWYAAMYAMHGQDLIRQFFTDQVGERLDEVNHLGNIGSYMGAYARHFAPWLILLLPILLTNPRRIADLMRAHRAPCLFLLTLWLVCLVIFLCGNMVRSRFLLPTFPVVAVLLAGIIDNGFERGRLQAWVSGLNFVLIGAGILCGTVLVFYGLDWGALIMCGGILLLLVAALSLFALRRWHGQAHLLSLGLLPLIYFAILGSTVRRWSESSPVPQWRRQIESAAVPGALIETCGVPSQFTSHLRLYVHANHRVKAVAQPSADFVVLGPKAADPDGYEVTARGTEYTDLKSEHLKRLLLGADPAAIDRERGVIYRWAERRN
jgi:4-amino-4-deoxy-L-arabinose transferase-like glycosyltransferase